MRAKLLALGVTFLSLGLSAPSRAATIVQDILNLNQNLGDFTPFDIQALPFDPTAGSLQKVTVELIGSYTPQTANDLGPFPATTDLTTRLFVFATNGGPTTNRILGTQTGVPVVASGGGAGIATGAATPVDQTFDLSDLAAFETGIAGTQLLVEYGFRTSNTLSGAGGASDLTSFAGHALLTYIYSVPEPSTALLLILPALAAILRRRPRG